MSGIGEGVTFATTRIRTVFADDLGNRRTGSGTAFWINTPDLGPVLITCRHNVDRALWNEPELLLAEFSVELRVTRHVPLPRPRELEGGTADTEFQTCTTRPRILLSPDADCAVVLGVLDRLPVAQRAYSIITLDEEGLADEAYFREELRFSNELSFIGFAGAAGLKWWDDAWNLPIARVCAIASHPVKPFENEALPTKDTLLVTGLSFAGSSGSPVISHREHFHPKPPKALFRDHGDHDAIYREPRILGVMSGHWSDHPTRSGGPFPHSGLSYLTRSTSIRRLLAHERSTNVAPTP